MTEIGVIMKFRRREMRLSLADVAKLTGLSKAHVWDLESGRATNPTIATLNLLGKALNVAPVELFKAINREPTP